jgi:hypothetical protein
MTPFSAGLREWDSMVLEASSASATPSMGAPSPQTWDPMSLEEVLPRPTTVVVTAHDLPRAPSPPLPPPLSPTPPSPPPLMAAPKSGDEAQARIDSFLSKVCTPLLPPVISTPALHRRARLHLPATEDGLPRQSTRVAAQGHHRVSNPEVQAQNVLMRKLGITSEERPPDADTIKAYNDIFNSLLGSAQCKAIRALLTAHCPQPSVEVVDMES